MTRAGRRGIVAAAVVAAFLAAAYLLTRECAFGGGMPGWSRHCTCLGLERLDYDLTAADGRRRTVCLGLVTSRTCHEYVGGPEVPCDTLLNR